MNNLKNHRKTWLSIENNLIFLLFNIHYFFPIYFNLLFLLFYENEINSFEKLNVKFCESLDFSDDKKEFSTEIDSDNL